MEVIWFDEAMAGGLAALIHQETNLKAVVLKGLTDADAARLVVSGYRDMVGRVDVLRNHDQFDDWTEMVTGIRYYWEV